jgi:hypothetical protein
MIERAHPERFRALLDAAQANVRERYARYEALAARPAKP